MTRKRLNGKNLKILFHTWQNCRLSQRIWGRGSEAKGCFAGGLILTAIICRQASQGGEKKGNKVTNSLDEHEFLSNEFKKKA